MQQMTITLQPELREKLKAYAKRHDLSESQAARKFIREGLFADANRNDEPPSS